MPYGVYNWNIRIASSVSKSTSIQLYILTALQTYPYYFRLTVNGEYLAEIQLCKAEQSSLEIDC